MTPDSDAGWKGTGHWIPKTPAGVYVTHESALTYSAIWCAVRVISETVAMLPWHVMRRLPNGGREAVGGTVETLLNTRPNPWMGAYSFRQLLVAYALLWGNGYAEIVRDGGGRPVEMWPIHPDRVMPWVKNGSDLYYRVRNDTDLHDIPARDIFHLRGPGTHSIVGQSVIALAARSIGLGIAAEEFGSSFFGNGAQLGVILREGPNSKLDDQGKINLMESFERRFSGSGSKAFKTFLADKGMEVETIGIPAKDAQFLETRTFQVTEVARWYRVPPHKLAHLDNSIKANIEEMGSSFAQDSILPWVRPLEQEADFKLLGANPSRFTRMNLNMLMRGDAKARTEYYSGMVNIGAMSPNDVRAREGMNPIPEGDVYMVQANMTTLDRVGENFDPATSEQARALTGVFDRMLAREGGRAKDAAGRYTRREFASWLDRFCRQHTHQVRGALREVLEAHGLWNDGARAETVGFVTVHVEESRALLMDAYTAGDVGTWCDEVKRARTQGARLLERILDAALAAKEV